VTLTLVTAMTCADLHVDVASAEGYDRCQCVSGSPNSTFVMDLYNPRGPWMENTSGAKDVPRCFSKRQATGGSISEDVSSFRWLLDPRNHRKSAKTRGASTPGLWARSLPSGLLIDFPSSGFSKLRDQ
jgi:hypothetical protein